MHPLRRLAIVASAAAVVMTGGVAPAAATPTDVVYGRLIPLEALGGTQAWATDMNARGDLVGYAAAVGSWHPAVWWQGRRTPTDLGFASGGFAAINNRGHIIGGDESGRVFLWRNGRVTYLRYPGPSEFSASHLNDRDQIAGTVTDGSGLERPVLWQRGRFVDLPVPQGMRGLPAGINNRGQVLISWYHPETLVNRVVLWQRGRTTELGTLGGASAWARGINERGQVIGVSEYDPDRSGDTHSFLWQRGRMRDLLVGTGATDFEVSAINNHGLIAGSARWPGSLQRPVLWRAGRLVDIGVPGRNAGVAVMNERGDVAGNSWLPTPDGTIVDYELFRRRRGHTTLYAKSGHAINIEVAGIDRYGNVGVTYESDYEGPELMRTAL